MCCHGRRCWGLLPGRALLPPDRAPLPGGHPPTRPAPTARRGPVIGTTLPAAAHRSLPGRAGPPQFPPPLSEPSPPLRRGVPRGRPPGRHRFHGRHRGSRGPALPCPPHGGQGNGAAGPASCHGPSGCLPTGQVTLGFDAGRSPRRRQPATGPPGSYPDRTSTGKRRRACTDAQPYTRSTSSLLGAPNSTYTRRNQIVSTVKQVARHDPLGLLAQEHPPGHGRAPWRRAQAVSSQQRPDGRGAHPDPKLA
jgi:hypothetical protein